MIYLLLLLLSFILTYLIKNYANKKSLVVEINERSSHSVPTPHGGGIAIAVTWFAGLEYLYFTDAINEQLFYALLSGAIIAIVSFFDDLYDLSPKVRLMTQALVAGLGIYFLDGLKELDFGLFSVTNQFLTNGFAFLLVVWFINLYNFLDGIDGYAAIEAVFLGLAGYFLFGGDYFLVMIVSVFGFLVWNWHKAKIFMGDVGSTLLGYNIAIFTIYYGNQNSKNFWIWIILFALFWFDATLTLYKRYKNGEKLSKAHKKHFYQRLHQSGWNPDTISIVSFFINGLFLLGICFISNIYIVLFLSIIFLYFITKYIDKKKSFR